MKEACLFPRYKKAKQRQSEGLEMSGELPFGDKQGATQPLDCLVSCCALNGLLDCKEMWRGSCVHTCRFPRNVHSMSSTSLPGVIKLPVDQAANIFLCCLSAPLFRHLTLPLLSPLSDSQLVGSCIDHTHTHPHITVFFSPLTAMRPCDFGIHHGHDQYQILDMSYV